VDALLRRGLTCISVLDVSAAALTRAQDRLGSEARGVTWIETDVTADWVVPHVDVWHDRAVFHFLTERSDRTRYLERLRRALRPGGTLVIATFAPDGPDKCSGLPVARYSAQMLASELGQEFRLVEAVSHQHRTASGSAQPFTYARFTRVESGAPIVTGKDSAAPSVFSPATLIREARRQKHMSAVGVPAVCMLDPDGDVVRWLQRTGGGTRSQTWPCYHSELYEFDLSGVRVGIVGCAVGAPYAVLVAEQMFSCGCELLISVTSSGQITKAAVPPYFVLVTRSLRDEGTSYHYQPLSAFGEANPVVLDRARTALQNAGVDVVEGATWTTDAPFRETAAAIENAERLGILAVEMESAALYAFAQAHDRAVICLAHVTNTMGQSDAEFEKGHEDGVAGSLAVVRALLGVRGAHDDGCGNRGATTLRMVQG
jgi:uridine phosphorylase